MDIEGDAGLAFLANLALETSASDCHPTGNYDADLDAPLRACCPGLHRVEQRVKVFRDDSTSACSFAPVGSFACIEGSCGDGRCEAAEAVACGCSLDCPHTD